MNTTVTKFKDVGMYQRFLLAFDASEIYEKVSLSKAQNINMQYDEVIECPAETRVYLIEGDITSPSYYKITVSNISALRQIPVIRIAVGWIIVCAIVYLIGEFLL